MKWIFKSMGMNLHFGRKWIYLGFVVIFPFISYGQIDVRGNVSDLQGEPLIGVNVQVKGSTRGTATDLEGGFELTAVDPNSTLIFSYVGYQTREIELDGRETISVIMESDAAVLDEVVVVGYGTQQRESVTGAVSQISGRELLRSPSGNMTNRLAGVVPGVVSLQSSGQPGADGASLLVRGASAKYIVDGVERSFSQIDPSEVETISVLKDAASASVYGLDANAVVIITTKRGRDQPSTIQFSGEYGVSSNTYMLDMLDGPDYAYWYNKALEMDGDQPIFTREHVEKMLNNDPDDGWGNTPWYENTFGLGQTTDVNVNARGGNDKMQYYVFLGTYNQEGNVENFNFNRINLRTNLDVEVATGLDLQFDVAGRIENQERPFYSAAPHDWNNIPQQAFRALPFVPSMRDGLPVSTRTSSSFVNPEAASRESGYHTSKTNLVETNFGLNYKIPFVDGLSAKFMAAYDISNNRSKSYSTPYETYVANAPTSSSDDISYTKSYDARGTTTSLTEGSSYSSRLTTNLSLRYDYASDRHDLSVLTLMETVQYDGQKFGAYGYGFDIRALDELDFASQKDRNDVSGGSSLQRKAGFLGKVSYSLDHKYLMEMSMRYDGSYVFGGQVAGKRWSPFPAASLGWRISEEDWFASRYGFVDELKLRGSIGMTGTTDVPPYFYLNTMSLLNSAVVLGGEARSGLLTSAPGNENLTWSKALQYNGGFESRFWNHRLGVEFDVFYKYIYDMLSPVSAAYPPSFGGYVHGYENNNKQDHRGFEIALTHHHSIGEFRYSVGINGTFTKRRWLRYNDSPNTPDWLKLTGKEVGAQVGFIAVGLFESEEEIENSALIEGRVVQVGDIKYLDRNGDGVISYEQDRGYIGKSEYPDFVGGLFLSGEWKNISLSMLFQGGVGRDVALTGVYPGGVMDHTSMTRPFYHSGNSPRYLLENSWTPDNPDAEFPRLSRVPASSNNAYSSTFWYRNGDYLRLKSMQIGYTVPEEWIRSTGISELSIQLQGQNLFTFSELNKYHIDPEQPGVSNGYYPQQKIYTVKVNLSF